MNVEPKKVLSTKLKGKCPRVKTKMNMGTAVRKHVTKKEGIIWEFTEEEKVLEDIHGEA